MPKIKIPAHYRRLAQVVVAEETRSLYCDEVERKLEAYLDAESSGEDARAIFPRVWAHLQSCVQCRTHYDNLRASPEE